MSLLDLSLATFGPQTEIVATPTALLFPENFPKEKWIESGRMLRMLVVAAKWWGGDWVAYGKKTYGDGVMELQEVQETVKQMEFDAVTTASCVKPGHRRETVAWNAHREVAELPEDKQEEWLSKMEAKGWDHVELRRQIRASFASYPAKGNAFVWNGGTKPCRERVNWLNGIPESFWVPQTRELWKKELKPIVEVWEGL